METTGPRFAGVALALAVGGAFTLGVGEAVGFRTPGTEAVFTLLLVAGWVLLGWAALVCGAVAVGLLRGRPAPVDIALVLATAVLIAVVVHAFPLVGSSGGAG